MLVNTAKKQTIYYFSCFLISTSDSCSYTVRLHNHCMCSSFNLINQINTYCIIRWHISSPLDCLNSLLDYSEQAYGNKAFKFLQTLSNPQPSHLNVSLGKYIVSFLSFINYHCFLAWNIEIFLHTTKWSSSHCEQ